MRDSIQKIAIVAATSALVFFAASNGLAHGDAHNYPEPDTGGDVVDDNSDSGESVDAQSDGGESAHDDAEHSDAHDHDHDHGGEDSSDDGGCSITPGEAPAPLSAAIALLFLAALRTRRTP